MVLHHQVCFFLLLKFKGSSSVPLEQISCRLFSKCWRLQRCLRRGHHVGIKDFELLHHRVWGIILFHEDNVPKRTFLPTSYYFVLGHKPTKTILSTPPIHERQCKSSLQNRPKPKKQIKVEILLPSPVTENTPLQKIAQRLVAPSEENSEFAPNPVSLLKVTRMETWAKQIWREV